MVKEKQSYKNIPNVIIRIDSIAERTDYENLKDNNEISLGQIVGNMVVIKKGKKEISFREDDENKLWKRIKECVCLK